MKAINIIYDIDYDDIYKAVARENTDKELDIAGFIDDLMRHNPIEINKFLDLPTEIEVPDDLFDGSYDDKVADYISDITGVCVQNFEIVD